MIALSAKGAIVPMSSANAYSTSLTPSAGVISR